MRDEGCAKKRQSVVLIGLGHCLKSGSVKDGEKRREKGEEMDQIVFLDGIAFGTGPPSGLSSVSSSSIGISPSVKEAAKRGNYRPKHPVVLIPGWCSSSLRVWKSKVPDWQGTPVWVSLSKLGSLPLPL